MGLDELSPRDKKIKYVYSLIQISVLNYNTIYDDLLKNAIKYGMSINEFWRSENYKIYFLYEEAYYERLHEEKHTQGLYNFIAFNTVIGNAFRDNKKQPKPLEYPKENMLITSKKEIIKNEKSANNKIAKNEITQKNIHKALTQRLCECY